LGTIVLIIHMTVDNLFYMNSIVMDIFKLDNFGIISSLFFNKFKVVTYE